MRLRGQPPLRIKILENNIIKSNDRPLSVALTGGSGFLGSRILQQLLEAGIHVTALERRTKLQEHKNLTIVQGGLSDVSALRALVKGADCVIHCGGAVAAPNAAAFQAINAQGTADLINAAEHENVARFLYISSLAAREPDISPYAKSKQAGEESLKLSTIKAWDIIRPPAIYGPGDLQMLPLIKLLQKRIGILPGGRQAKVSVIYVDDLAAAVCRWLFSGATKQNIYEIDDGHENGYTWQELLGKAAKIMNVTPYYLAPPSLLMKIVGNVANVIGKLVGKTPFLTADKFREFSHLDWVRHEKRIEKEIGWVAQTEFEQGMKQTLLWYQKEELLK